jgi:acyl carrier protein
VVTSMNEPVMGSLEAHILKREDTLTRVRRVLTEGLKVPLAPDEIDLDAPLFGTGLGLDSVDAVELVVAIETEFGLRIPEGTGGPWALRTVHALVEFVIALEGAMAQLAAAGIAVPVAPGSTS